MSDSILVSVGIAVRNGGEIFRFALDSVLQQSHKNIEIIISNNDSTDLTQEICLEAAAKDPRIKYFKQNKLIPALDNFKFVFERASGTYFMWAAHDDLRSANYIEVLLKGFEQYPEASVVFSHSKQINDSSFDFDSNGSLININTKISSPILNGPELFRYDAPPYFAPFNSFGMPFYERHARMAKSLCVEIYGLIQTEKLIDYPWYRVVYGNYGSDNPLLHWLHCKGDFIYQEGACFYYYIGNVFIKETSRKLEKPAFHVARHCAVCARSSVAACNLRLSSIQGLYLFLRSFFTIYLSRHGGLFNFFIKSVIYTWLPLPIKNIWRSFKKPSVQPL